MRYHADMEFRVDGEHAGEYHRGRIGLLEAIDFETWLITLRMPDGQSMTTRRRAVTLVNHENCDAPCGCTADQDRTAGEP